MGGGAPGQERPGGSVTAEEMQTITERMLEEGVPPGVVARVLDLDDELVKETQSQVRVKRYGTDDLGDYTEQMQWKMMEVALNTLENGSVAEKARVMSTVLGKQISAVSKRSPESERSRARGRRRPVRANARWW